MLHGERSSRSSSSAPWRGTLQPAASSHHPARGARRWVGGPQNWVPSWPNRRSVGTTAATDPCSWFRFRFPWRDPAPCPGSAASGALSPGGLEPAGAGGSWAAAAPVSPEDVRGLRLLCPLSYLHSWSPLCWLVTVSLQPAHCITRIQIVEEIWGKHVLCAINCTISKSHNLPPNLSKSLAFCSSQLIALARAAVRELLAELFWENTAEGTGAVPGTGPAVPSTERALGCSCPPTTGKLLRQPRAGQTRRARQARVADTQPRCAGAAGLPRPNPF